ncbi:hypothetical protein llap_939 [Limosa lapponica baueri]|uniref:Uncharacterized protein n=1 Tax=Limosa lapponica baueri TaxID=1758121 RepID=A0A2I0URS8_LIMLA|nr:hypothetical protein llap_939 [Limosa lapponica baueri]
MEKIMVMKVVSLQPNEDNSGADIHTAVHGGSYTAAGGYALKEDAACGYALKEAAACGYEPTQEQAPGSNYGL